MVTEKSTASPTYQPKREHFEAMRDFHYRAADLLAKEAEKCKIGSAKRSKLLADCAAAIELAEQCRVSARTAA